MKQIIFVFFMALLTLPSHAQTTGSHAFRIDDHVTKQIVAYTVKDDAGENRVWDLRGLEEDGGSHNVCYTDVYGRDSLVAGVEHNTLHYYAQRHDSLMTWGYENNLTKVDYDCPILLLRTPLTYGSRHEGVFHGTEGYCERVFSRVAGTYSVEVDGTGMMLLPDGDTLRHVSRIHLRELTASIHCPQIGTLRALRAYADSLPYTTDSVRKAMTADSLVVVTDTYRWYAAGYRYPILEVVSTGRKGKSPDHTVAYYTEPEELAALDDEENRKERERLAAIDSMADGNSGKDGGRHNALPSALSRYDVTVSGQTVTIDYELTAGATVRGLVCNVTGMVFRQHSQTYSTGGHYQMQLDCTGLRRGQYVLYLNVNGEKTGTTINL